MIDGITKEQELFIIKTLKKHFPSARYILFGSRLGGNYRKYSDIDIAIDNGAELPAVQWSELEGEFEESDLPYLVDLSDYHRLTEDFRKIVDTTGQDLV